MNKVTISLEELNDQCKEQGLKPFPIRSFTFDSDSDQHLELSVRSFTKQVEEWIRQQHNIKREVFAGLVREVVPATTILWRTSEGYSFTAKQLLEEIENGSEIGRQYAADLLRVARDFLKRQALRGETP